MSFDKDKFCDITLPVVSIVVGAVTGVTVNLEMNSLRCKNISLALNLICNADNTLDDLSRILKYSKKDMTRAAKLIKDFNPEFSNALNDIATGMGVARNAIVPAQDAFDGIVDTAHLGRASTDFWNAHEKLHRTAKKLAIFDTIAIILDAGDFYYCVVVHEEAAEKFAVEENSMKQTCEPKFEALLADISASILYTEHKLIRASANDISAAMSLIDKPYGLVSGVVDTIVNFAQPVEGFHKVTHSVYEALKEFEGTMDKEVPGMESVPGGPWTYDKALNDWSTFMDIPFIDKVQAAVKKQIKAAIESLISAAEKPIKTLEHNVEKELKDVFESSGLGDNLDDLKSKMEAVGDLSELDQLQEMIKQGEAFITECKTCYPKLQEKKIERAELL